MAEQLITRGQVQVPIGKTKYKLKISPYMSGDVTNLQVRVCTLVQSSTHQPQESQCGPGAPESLRGAFLVPSAAGGPYVHAGHAVWGLQLSPPLCLAAALPLHQDRSALRDPRCAG